MIGREVNGVIYAIKNLDNKILYIGNTRRVQDVSKRFSEHMRQIKNNKHKYITKDVRKANSFRCWMDSTKCV